MVVYGFLIGGFVMRWFLISMVFCFSLVSGVLVQGVFMVDI